MNRSKVLLLVLFALVAFGLSIFMGYVAWHAPDQQGYRMGFGACAVFLIAVGAAERAVDACDHPKKG